MANRVGIELLPYVCRIVEVRAKAGRVAKSRGPTSGTRVRTVCEIPYLQAYPEALTAELRQALRGRTAIARRARVAIWGLRCTHLGLLLPPAAATDLHALARREARMADASQAAPASPSASTSDGIVIGELREGGRREVGYVSADANQVNARLQPLRDAGFEIEAAVTPALAHAVLVRQRWSTAPDQVTAVLEVNARATALTVLRGTVVLFSRELPWGSGTPRSDQPGAVLDTTTMAGRLASEVKRSLVYVNQQRQIDVSHVLICGDTPDLRSLTGPLMHELNVEAFEAVERLPEAAAQFRGKVAALRPALAIGSAPDLPIDLQPRSPGLTGFVTPATLRRMGVAAGLACAAIGLAWGTTTYLTNQARMRVETLRIQVTRLDPETRRQAQARQAASTAAVQLDALEAFGSQGPRLALVLDAVRRAPLDLAITSLHLTSSPSGTWPVSVRGQIRSATAADAESSFSVFLKSASASTFLGVPTRSPDITIGPEGALPTDATPGVSGRRAKTGAGNGAVLDFALSFEVKK
jgi:Tfp pilus assembly PilM family ATPase